jgi:hypothetical protein
MISNLNTEGDTVTFTFKDDDYSVINMYRRIAVGGYIPCVAIADVDILKNDTIGINETELSHKFESIRIKQKVPEGTLFALDKTNDTNGIILVTYGDVIATYENKTINDAVFYPNAYFLALMPGQALKITGKAEINSVWNGGHSGYLSTGSFGYDIKKKCSLQIHEQFTYVQIMKKITDIAKSFLDKILAIAVDGPIEIPGDIDVGVVFAIRAELIRTYPDLFPVLNKPGDTWILDLGLKTGTYDYIKNACDTIRTKL